MPPGKAAKRKQNKAKSQAQVQSTPPEERRFEGEEEGEQGEQEFQESEEFREVAQAPTPAQKKKEELSPRTTTGDLDSHPLSRDIKIINFSLRLYGQELVLDTALEFNYGRRYGLIGLNGSGKSTLLTCVGQREVPIPGHINVWHLDKEAPHSEKTAIEFVLEDLEREKRRMEEEAEELATMDDERAQERLTDLYDALDELDVDTALARAAKILYGLGFSAEMQQKKTKDFSGGWRMRIALAKALFMKPTMLLLDEPTNHLDLEATVWLEDYLKNYNKILVLVSHSQDFLNNVCTNIIHLQNKKLSYYSGNYDAHIVTRFEKEVNQMKQYQWEQGQIQHMKDYVARFGHGSKKLAAQAKSKQKLIDKMEEKGLTEVVVRDKLIVLRFQSCGPLPPPVVQFNKVSFGYPGQKNLLYKDLDFGIDLDSRVALVGPNGVGKSTLLKLIVDTLTPTSGIIRRHNHLRIAWYHQHLTEHLDLAISPLEFMLKSFPDQKEPEAMRRIIGRFGITGKAQTTPIGQLSDGQKSRVVFSWLAFKEPHLLLLDEPTNHLDIETIDALAEAINEFEGGMVLVSHDFRLINQVAKEIWVCENKTVSPWKGDILSYKEHLRQKMNKE